MDHAVDEDEDEDENGNFIDGEAGETKIKKKKVSDRTSTASIIAFI